MDNRLTVARRELASLRSEKTIVLAILIQLFVAAFSSFLAVGLVSLYDPGSVSNGFVVEFAVTGEASDDIEPVIEAEDGWRAVEYGSYETALRSFERGEVHAVLRVERGPAGRAQVDAIAPDGNVRTTLVVTQIKNVVEAFERTERGRLSSRLTRQPVELPGDAPASPYFSFTYTVLVPLLTFLPIFVSGSIAVDAIAEEYDRGTLELLRVTPLTATDIVDGKLLAMGILAPAQAGAWLALLSFNGTAIANPVEILVLVAGVSVGVVTLGATTALAFRERKQAQFLFSMGVLVAFSATYLLPESPPNAVAKLAIGSPTRATHLAVGAYVLVSLVAFVALRRVVAGRGLGE
ncbi:ABC transporter permease [Halorussus litoreus]|uniref:ABC transporter permease n=1 Tax=Halorussus litoreus TaxID=1710536 RepID=UPI0018E53B59|nr:ABC transporter permease [Halorussus litoreus]